MDLTELADRTDLTVRGIRYVLDHGLLPGLRGRPRTPGVARLLTEFEAFGVALAARLLAAGLSRRLTAAALSAACREPLPRDDQPGAPLFVAYRAAGGELGVADGMFVRVRIPRATGAAAPYDTGWVPATRSEPPPADFTPRVWVTAELGGLIADVRGRRPGGGKRAGQT
jgi:hypothetical protein